ncbi:hypothetical protein M501DRAFT_936828 [Patellaria atrata CBS 101060]|uniref:Cyclin-D1-binding protein 1-like N-terminal domain-containing protein n=1 Tax=Patellaria atrata CBS 101060 TaxID=1346257 RepID=A0A9P4VLM6_9PEZI|nr:hypothetical protein M501DRAFT_936828 [Patellaria atrata CBS 101060]
MAFSSPQNDIQSLKSLTNTTLALLTQFQTSLTSSSRPTSPSPLPANPPNPLAVLRDAATLLKAHTTKLSLLLLNDPFTPSAVAKVVRDISGTCLPAMMGAVEICRATSWGATMNHEVRLRVGRVVREVQNLLRETGGVVEGFERGERIKGKEKARSGGKEGRDSLASTGVVWEACDALVALERMGLVGVVVRKAEEYRAMLADAVEELRDWADEEDEMDDEDDDTETGAEERIQDQILGAPNKLAGNEDLRGQLERTLKKLKTIGMLYQALIKRRLRTFPPIAAAGGSTSTEAESSSRLATLDRLMEILKAVPEFTDELASAFYELDAKEADKYLEKSCLEASKAVAVVNLNWDGYEDVFTDWSARWLEAITNA